MKKILLFSGLLSVAIACKKNENQDVIVNEKPIVEYEHFGTEINDLDATDPTKMLEVYNNLKQGDTVNVKFASNILDVCQKKGCWMKMDLKDENSVFVKFKDYAFFVPLNAAGSNAVIEGKAFLNVQEVDELKHYAKDAGKTQEEIDLITEPKITYGFMADGVLIQK